MGTFDFSNVILAAGRKDHDRCRDMSRSADLSATSDRPPRSICEPAVISLQIK